MLGLRTSPLTPLPSGEGNKPQRSESLALTPALLGVSKSMSGLEASRQFWDEKARENPYGYVSSEFEALPPGTTNVSPAIRHRYLLGLDFPNFLDDFDYGSASKIPPGNN